MIDHIDRLLFNQRILGAIPIEKKIRIERIIGFDYDAVLKNVMECQDISSVNLTDNMPEQQLVTTRYFRNKAFLEEQIQARFLTKNKFNEQQLQRINDFIEFLKNKVAVVRILASKFDVAYQIFEILNNRGLPLSNKDLLRNFIISEFAAIQSGIDPVQKWQKLEDSFALDNDFISRFVESTNAKKLF